MIKDQFGRELLPQPVFQLDDEIRRGRRVETHLRKGRVRGDGDRRIVDGAPEVGDAPLAYVGFACLSRRQPTPPSTTISGIGPLPLPLLLPARRGGRYSRGRNGSSHGLSRQNRR